MSEPNYCPKCGRELEYQVPKAKSPDEAPTIIEDFPTSRVSADYVRSLPADGEEELQDE